MRDNDRDILTSLFDGYHLEEKDIKRARELLSLLNFAVEQRVL